MKESIEEYVQMGENEMFQFPALTTCFSELFLWCERRLVHFVVLLAVIELSRSFYPQLLFVPEKRNHGTEVEETQESSDSLLPPQGGQEERRPSVTDALRIPYRRASERAHRFLKVKARHFTDGQGVVSGVLIITPNAVMFDPNVSDPLVIEHGIESYGVIAPLDMLMRAAIYFDIAHMKVQHAAQDAEPRPKVDIYYGKMIDDQSLNEEEKDSAPPLQVKAPSIEVDTVVEKIKVPETTSCVEKEKPSETVSKPKPPEPAAVSEPSTPAPLNSSTPEKKPSTEAWDWPLRHHPTSRAFTGSGFHVDIMSRNGAGLGSEQIKYICQF
ncbi:nuclear receptor coactivator 7 [Trichonephila clavipes]|nr:nuclear receptor coactivator 7 [Trichonephila clavipes]